MIICFHTPSTAPNLFEKDLTNSLPKEFARYTFDLIAMRLPAPAIKAIPKICDSVTVSPKRKNAKTGPK
ncbi:MAG: hypothetical protein AAF891_06255, partial [Pseudomonadota bacterium]